MSGAGASVQRDRAPLGAPALAAALLIAALVLAVFWPCLSAELLNFDDDRNFVQNAHFRGLRPANLRWLATTFWMGHYQPLSWLSLAADFVLSGDIGNLQRATPRFHAVNLGLHVLTALLVALFSREVFRRLRLPREGLAATAAALFFALHPQRVESVAWVTERRDVLSAPFFLAALYAYLRAHPRGTGAPQRSGSLLAAALAALLAAVLALAALDLSRPDRLSLAASGPALLAGAALALAGSTALAARGSAGNGSWLAAGVALALCSLGAKAWAVVLPALLVVLDVGLLGRGRSPRALLALLLEKAPFWALSALFLRLAAAAQAGQIATWKSLSEHGALERVLQACYGLCYYLWQTFTLGLRGLSPIHELPDRIALGSPRFGWCALAVLTLAIGAWRWRRRVPLTVTALGAFAVIVSPVLGLAQSGPQLVADRYTYLAAVPLAMLAVARLGRAELPRWEAKLGLALVALALGFTSHRYAREWHSSLSLWSAAVARQPHSATARLSLGALLEERAREEKDPRARSATLEEAQRQLERALELRRDGRVLSGLASIAAQRAELEPERAGEHRARALDLSREAVALATRQGAFLPELRLNLGLQAFKAGLAEEGLEDVRAFLRERPDSAFGWRCLTVMRLELGQFAEALEPSARWVALASGDAQAHRLRGEALLRLERRAEAIAAFERALALDPENGPLRRRLEELR